MADVSVTAANVLMSTGGQPADGVIAAGVTITQGQSLYVLDNGTIGLADADGATPAPVFAGIAMTAGGPGQPIRYATTDTGFTPGFTATAGAPVYQSDTPGGLTVTFADLETGDRVTVVGVMLTATTMNLRPLQGGVI